MSRGGKAGPPDRYWMGQALSLAALCEGLTSPNPRVGCVLVREGDLVGRGFHHGPGLAHAEALALAEAGERAAGATLYVNLEPCAHEGRTPPCADLLVASGVGRVVASLEDPNPVVSGRGFDRLRAAGIAVEVGLLEGESRRLNEAFIHRHERGRPLVTIKAASSFDGMLSAARGESRWISGAEARRFAHRLRWRHDAVLVGAGTVRRDDPRLTVRLPGLRGKRLRAVLAPSLDVDPEARLFDGPGPHPLIYASRELGPEKESAWRGRADVVRIAATGGRLDLTEVLADLTSRGVQSVLVEGGARTFAGFFDAGLADRIALFLAGRLLGSRGGTPLLDRESVGEPAAAWRVEGVRQLALGRDLLMLGALRPPDST